MTADSRTFPFSLRSESGLCVQLNANGSIRRIDKGDVVLNLFVGNEVEGGPANLYLRARGEPIEWTPLLGPRSPAAFEIDEKGLTARGEWKGIRFTLSLVLAESAAAWFWHVELVNGGSAPRSVDLIHAQDLALAAYGAVRSNEYYVSQYVDYAPLSHPERGTVLAVRQNLAMDGRHPWALIGSLGSAAGYATDALQLHGKDTRAGRAPAALTGELPASRLQHEHSMAVLQERAVRLDAGAAARIGFFGWFEEDHPDASSASDLAFVERAMELPEAAAPRRMDERGSGIPPAATLFSACACLESLDLTEAEIAEHFGEERGELERDGAATLSFFAGEHRHVVLKAKELAVLRPHGHIIRTGDGLTPDEASLTSTAWMGGVFHSMVTQGHVSINRFLSTTRSYLGLFCSPGQRIFVELDGGYRLLGIASAFEMTPGSCRWLYKHAGGLIEARAWAATDRHELGLSLEVLSGAPCRFLISHHLALDGDDGAEAMPVRWKHDEHGVAVSTLAGTELGRRFPDGFFRIDPEDGTPIERIGGDEILFLDGRARGESFLAVVTAPSAAASFRITGGLIAPPPTVRARRRAADESTQAAFWRGLTGPFSLRSADGGDAGLSRFCRILPWLAHDAMIHYLAPRGLEQFSGGGWGTRDVSQGPVEMLLALGRPEPVRDILLRVFRQQNPDGDWPQWFMFFERERTIRPDDSHGDIVFWPVLALAEYLLASGDASVLDEVVPFFHPDGDGRAEHAAIGAHVERALAVMRDRVIPDTHLAAYGHGDWNDSLQPVDPSMRERLCSSWTVTLHFQTLTALSRALRRVDRPDGAAELEGFAAGIRDDFQRLLIAGDTLAGFAYFHPDRRIDYLLHPSDRRTGIRYRLLPMIHAIINGLLTPEQAKTHVGFMREHLLGADGARLFDRPPEYRGGPQRLFQRAESSTYFGREIGIMYMHAHLRYAEAMARYGDADAFFLALRQANPIGIGDAVPGARPRQSNCYYSSSDAAVADRYEGLARYAEIRAGAIPFEGGWRVYSSGAGIALRLIRERFLGLAVTRSELTIDPVIPPGLDGLRAETDLDGAPFRVVYRTGSRGCGPKALLLNGRALPFEREANPYRTAGAVVGLETLRRRRTTGRNELVVEVE